jgi:hypothetical protein
MPDFLLDRFPAGRPRSNGERGSNDAFMPSRRLCGSVYSSHLKDQVSYALSASAGEPCESRSSTHLPNSERGSRKITTESRNCGWVFTTNAHLRKVLLTAKHWRKLCVSDGSMECARASTRPPTNSGSLRESRRATGAQSTRGGRVSLQSLAEWRLRGSKRSSDARANPLNIRSSHDRKNWLPLTRSSSKLTPRHGNSSGHKRPGTSGRPSFGS